jgi:hypothetical protein
MGGYLNIDKWFQQLVQLKIMKNIINIFLSNIAQPFSPEIWCDFLALFDSYILAWTMTLKFDQ